MSETQHADGDIGAGLRGLISSIVANDRVLPAFNFLSAVGAAAAWAFIPDLWSRFLEAHASTRSMIWPVTVTVVALGATGLPLWLEYHRRWLAREIAEEMRSGQAELIALIQAYLIPCIETLPAVSVGGPDGREALAGVRRALLGTVQQICGPNGGGVRAVWFEVQRQTLVAKEWTGGNCNSRRKFANNSKDKAGTATWETARTGLPVLYADLTKQAPSGYQRRSDSNYQTFITCGVLGAQGEVVGMLNVDAPSVGDLTEIDKTVVGVCAKVLGVAVALSETRRRVALSVSEGE